MKKRALQHAAGHVLFWAAVLVFFTFFYGNGGRNFTQTLFFVAPLLPVAIATAYTLGDVLVPRFLFRRRYGRFVLYAAYTVVISLYLEMVIVIVSFIFGADYRIEDMDPASLDLTGLVVGLYVVVFLALCIRLAQRAFALQSSQAQIHQDQLETSLKLREAELALLKAQIHPHFLFNTLNNLYGLTLERSDLAPDIVLGLSDLLDYILYKGAADHVPLQQEIDFLQAYLALERIRYNGRLDVQLDADGAEPDAAIAPLLLVPLLENCFKHGVRPDAGRSWIRIRLETEGTILGVTITNSKPSGGQGEQSTPQRLGQGISHGLGLDNVRRRLELLYSGTHEIEIVDEPGRFTVKLHINLDERHASIAPRG